MADGDGLAWLRGVQWKIDSKGARVSILTLRQKSLRQCASPAEPSATFHHVWAACRPSRGCGIGTGNQIMQRDTTACTNWLSFAFQGVHRILRPVRSQFGFNRQESIAARYFLNGAHHHRVHMAKKGRGVQNDGLAQTASPTLRPCLIDLHESFALDSLPQKWHLHDDHASLSLQLWSPKRSR